jgi:ribose transport system ATP-binding protein
VTGETDEIPGGDTRIASGVPLLVTEHVTKSFFGAPALRDGSLTVCTGEIHALLGENGAGKSTLIKIVAGVYQRDGGAVWIGGQEMPARITPARVRELGVAFIHQDLALVQDATVAENIAIVDGYPKRNGLVSLRRMREEAARRLQAVGSDIDPRALVGELTSADQALVAIARALVGGAKLVVLDEPSARLRRPEVEHLFERLRRLKARGASFVYITHRLSEVFELADRVTVLRDGATVASHVVGDVSEPDLIADIVGRALGEVFPEPRVEQGHEEVPVLRVSGLSTPHVSDVSLEVHPHEIVGLAGLVSRAPTSIARAAFGVEEVLAGQVEVNGRPITQGRYSRHVGEVAYVPGDRHKEGLVMDLTVRENVLLGELVMAAKPSVRQRRPAGWLPRPTWIPRDERQRARRAIAEFQVKPPDPEAAVASLSGGNQQKVLLAKWISTRARLLILEEPTAGVDIGTKAEIYRMVARLAEQGAAVLLVTSDFEEVALLAHRVLVLRRGRIAVELDRDNLSRERVSAESYRAG